MPKFPVSHVYITSTTTQTQTKSLVSKMPSIKCDRYRYIEIYRYREIESTISCLTYIRRTFFIGSNYFNTK